MQVVLNGKEVELNVIEQAVGIRRVDDKTSVIECQVCGFVLLGRGVFHEGLSPYSTPNDLKAAQVHEADIVCKTCKEHPTCEQCGSPVTMCIEDDDGNDRYVCNVDCFADLEEYDE